MLCSHLAALAEAAQQQGSVGGSDAVLHVLSCMLQSCKNTREIHNYRYTVSFTGMEIKLSWWHRCIDRTLPVAAIHCSVIQQFAAVEKAFSGKLKLWLSEDTYKRFYGSVGPETSQHEHLPILSKQASRFASTGVEMHVSEAETEPDKQGNRSLSDFTADFDNLISI